MPACAFALRMDASSVLNVCEARDGQPILAGHAYIAPGDQHLLVARDGARYQCRLSDGDLVNRHRPSVDVMFRSVAQSAGRNSMPAALNCWMYSTSRIPFFMSSPTSRIAPM